MTFEINLLIWIRLRDQIECEFLNSIYSQTLHKFVMVWLTMILYINSIEPDTICILIEFQFTSKLTFTSTSRSIFGDLYIVRNKRKIINNTNRIWNAQTYFNRADLTVRAQDHISHLFVRKQNRNSQVLLCGWCAHDAQMFFSEY